MWAVILWGWGEGMVLNKIVHGEALPWGWTSYPFIIIPVWQKRQPFYIHSFIANETPFTYHIRTVKHCISILLPRPVWDTLKYLNDKFPRTLFYSSAHEIPTHLYSSSLKKVPLNPNPVTRAETPCIVHYSE